jgi:hydrogenase/urease accessory protein HupE
MRRAARVLAAAACLSAAAPADAHLVTTGLGPVYDGIAHFAVSPPDVALVVALTLLAGMRGARAGRGLLTALPPAWLAGGAAGLFLPVSTGFDVPLAACFLITGILVAADRNLAAGSVAALAAFIGAFHGFLAGSALSDAPSGGLELLGGLVALVVVATLVAGAVVSLRVFWARVAVRVLGSWIAATGLLMLGWALRARR